MDLFSPAAIRAIRARYGFHNAKSLGQNFLTDKRVIYAMIGAAGICPEDLVIEIGPGIGVLTVEAARCAGRVVAIEIDKALIPILKDNLEGADNVDIINKDVLRTDINDIIRGSCMRSAKIVGNLPYYITTPIIIKLLSESVDAESITIMMQREVAERITAEPGSRTYGALSVAVQYHCKVETVVDVPKESFMPAPKVDSRVLKLMPGEKKVVTPVSEDMFFRCVKAGFAQRRKTLLNSLTGGGFDRETVRDVLAGCGIDASRRPETLSLRDFADIADGFCAVSEK